MERLTLPVGLNFPKTVFEISIEFDTHLKSTNASNTLPIPTGFSELDKLIGGGLAPETLMLVGGPPGVGKTIFTLQVARNIAAAGNAVACVVCFEHSEVYLYQRLLCMESAFNIAPDGQVTLADIQQVIGEEGASLEKLLGRSGSARAAWSRLVNYWERLSLIKGHPSKTTLNVLDTYLSWLAAQGERVVLFLDYLQKIPVMLPGVEMTDGKQIRLVTEGLKNLALAHRVPIVAVATSDEEGLKNERVRFQDLRGGSSVQYEPDIALILNRRSDAKVTFSVDKNRLGPAMQEFSLSLSGETYSFGV